MAQRAEDYLKASGIGDSFWVGPEPEFFVFDQVQYKADMSGAMFKIHSAQAAWSSDAEQEGGNRGHRIAVRGGYMPVAPNDPDHEIRTSMCNALEEMGQEVEVHHHEVATAGQNEIGVKFNTLVSKADEVQTLKYVVRNVADAYGRTATFMPKPLYGDNGSGMHVHMSITADGKNIFAGEGYSGLSDTALYFIGGIIKHAKALNALTNPSTNSYKRLVPGFEAPVMLAYSARNRSAAIRIPITTAAQGASYRARFPDPSANPYLAFAALLMAGLDGIRTASTQVTLPTKTCMTCRRKSRGISRKSVEVLAKRWVRWIRTETFCCVAGVSNDFIDAYIELKSAEDLRVRTFVHPLEYELYYSC